MIPEHTWPDEFADPTPDTNFGDALTELLNELVASGCRVTANEHWSWFSVSRGARMVNLVRRGRLGDHRDYCWEVRLSTDSRPVQLGKVFGIRDYACVVIASMESVRNVTTAWLVGDDVRSLLRKGTFWDKMDTKQPLLPPLTERATDD